MTKEQLLNCKGIHDVMTFGKHKGSAILDVLNEDPSYLVWCIKNVSGFKIDEVLKEELLRQYERHQNRPSNEMKMELSLMRNYGMHVTEAMNFIDFDDFPHY